MTSPVVAALYVDPRGPYWGRPDVDAWDESRDAREYKGPHSVVAHPPCGRWCRLAKLVQSRYPSLKVGDDGGCFFMALEHVHRWGGVIEHPAWSIAWAHHDLIAPDVGGWTRVMNPNFGDWVWVCEVNQAAYGHPATKATWLYYVGRVPPSPMNWARTKGSKVIGHCKRSRGGMVFRDGKNTVYSGTHLTPHAFAAALIELARNCGGAP